MSEDGGMEVLIGDFTLAVSTRNMVYFWDGKTSRPSPTGLDRKLVIALLEHALEELNNGLD